MELWIRSQDKNVLENVKGFCITHSDENRWNILNVDTTTRYGTYKTKERALEVLDEIQRILHPTLLLSAEINTNDNNWVVNGIMYQKYKDSYSIQELSTYVYEMPKD